MATVNGTSGSDFIHVAGDGYTNDGAHGEIATATNNDDVINSGGGGSDIIHAGSGSDVIYFGDDLDATDQVDGGGDYDTVVIQGQTSVVFGADSLMDIEEIQLPTLLLPVNVAGFQDLTMNDANVAAGRTLKVNAVGLNADTFFTFDGSAERDGQFYVVGGHGADTITGGRRADVFDLSGGGVDTVVGGGGDDLFYFGDAFTASDSVTGSRAVGGELSLGGASYAANLTFTASTLKDINLISLADGYSYSFTSNDANVSAGKQLMVNASLLTVAGARLVFDGSAETDGSFYFYGGDGDDVLTGGAKADTFNLFKAPFLFSSGFGGGADICYGGGGADTFIGVLPAGRVDGGAGYDTVSVSTGSFFGGEFDFAADTIQNVEQLTLDGVTSYVMNDANVAAGATMTVYGAPFLFDGSAETDGHFHVKLAISNDGSWKTGAQSDVFDLQSNHTAVVEAGGGADIIRLGAGFDSFDAINGGDGSDTAFLDGDYSLALTFTADMLTNVETLVLAAGHSYDLITDQATVAAGKVLMVNGRALGATDNLTFDGSAETDGRFSIAAGAGVNHLIGGSGDDIFSFDPAGMTKLDSVAAGAGSDRLVFTAAGSVSVGDFSHITGIDRISLADGVNNIALSDGLVSSSDAHLLYVVGGSGRDTINGGGVTTVANRLYITGGGGADTMIAGAGADRFIFAAAADSTGPTYDTIKAINFNRDHLDLPASVNITGIDTALGGGVLDGGSNFNLELQLDLAGHLHAHHAILYTPDAGALAGQTFLVADMDGVDGYLGGADLVIRLMGQVGALGMADFI